jgi:Tol biopolymer transport system component/DNA-binding winged helix-turn-helix (wHTH) protein
MVGRLQTRPLAGDRIRFGVFEVDPKTGELRKHGIRISLSEQPFRVLMALLERPRELVTRQDLGERLRPGDSYGDLDQAINRAVNKVRAALSDTAVNPRFVETLPGRGYRFIGPVEPPPGKLAPKSPYGKAALVVLAACLLAVAGLAVNSLTPAPIPALSWRRLTTDNYNKVPPALSDGARVYFLAVFGGEQFLAQVPIAGGQPSRLPITPPGPVCVLQDLSPDGQEFLLTAAAASNRQGLLPLWSLRIADGSARRLGSIEATSASYSADGRIAYTTEHELWLAEADGSQPRRLAELGDSLLNSVFWSPDGSRIRFAQREPLSSLDSAWEIRFDGTGLRRVLPEWGARSHRPGGWLPGHSLSIFSADGNFWAIREGWAPFSSDGPAPRKLTEDEREFLGSVRLRNTSAFHLIGIDRLGELQRYDSAASRWLPLLDGISAENVTYSRDANRLAYVTYPQRTLWVRQADGSRPVQLTSPPMAAALPRWSPDGRTIAFMAQQSQDQPWRIYLVEAEGGAIRAAVPAESGSQSDPAWSPDGTKLLYGLRGASNTREDVYIRLADLKTGQVAKFPGSEGLFGPRWSPDGSMIAALEWDDPHRLMVHRLGEEGWDLVVKQRADWPIWTPDSKAILFRSGSVVLKVRLSDRTAETMTEFKDEESGGFWGAFGVAKDGSLLRTLNRDSQQVYELRFLP